MMATHGPTADVLAEQEKVTWCDMIIFQSPMWWFGMPAILKGRVDRVMTRGFAYAKSRKYDTGMFKSRRAMICTTIHITHRTVKDNIEVSRWLAEVANERIHGTSEIKPCVRLRQELPHLQPITTFDTTAVG